jgi:hypothetical protein
MLAAVTENNEKDEGKVVPVCRHIRDMEVKIHIFYYTSRDGDESLLLFIIKMLSISQIIQCWMVQ